MSRYRTLAATTAAFLAVVFLLPAMTAFGVQTDPVGGIPAKADPAYSPRLIVELESPSIVDWATSGGGANPTAGVPTADGVPAVPADVLGHDGRVNLAHPAARAYADQLASEHQAFEDRLAQAVPGSRVSTYRDAGGAAHPLAYSVVFNGLAVDAGLGIGATRAQLESVATKLAAMPDVKHVAFDRAHAPDMYKSLDLINAPTVWDMVGGRADGGRGVKVASMDGGLYYGSPMFNGDGFSYPAGYPLGYTSNTNGKIIVSRAYFRDWDPPNPGDDTPWPVQGTTHGIHTAGSTAGDIVEANFNGITLTLSGVAPGAWLMSYRVFYNSVNGIGSFYDAEGIAALEDIVKDHADVVNNSWGGGPTSFGGDYDALDTALVNAWRAGVFVSMSNGNAGPGLGTGDHPAEDYINVAASTTGGQFSSGFLDVTAPEPVSDVLKMVGIGTAGFGAPLPDGQVVGPFGYKAAANVDEANIEGCLAWESGVFDGVAAVVSRGTCQFSVKAYYAEQAGATAIVIYNNQSDSPMGMAAGDHAGEVTIPVVSVGKKYGEAMTAWETLHGDAVRFQVSNTAIQVGNTPDQIIGFSSRGPAVGNYLKPDIAAPGVNIISQGLDGGSGVGANLTYGQASGTSMAAPHVSGAAALIRQVHPEWTNAEIKSALMTTSKFMGVTNTDGSPAQPLDMGAGRFDLAHATDPGLVASPPSLSYGLVVTGTSPTVDFTVTSVADEEETYSLSTVYTGGGFTATVQLAGVTVDPPSVTLAPGDSATIHVTWSSADAMGMGDNQGFLVLAGTTHNAHLPMWMRVVEPEQKAMLLIDNDGSGLPADLASQIPGAPFADYAPVYMEALGANGYSNCAETGAVATACYDVYDADAHAGDANAIPDAGWLIGYKTIVWETGDNYVGAGTPLTGLDFDRLVEYVNEGGKLIAFGQDLASTMGLPNSTPTLYDYGLGSKYIQDSVTGGNVMTRSLELMEGVPNSGFQGMTVDLSALGDGAGNQGFVDEIQSSDSDSLQPRGEPLMMSGSSAFTQKEGYVAMGVHEQPSLERPGISSVIDTAYFAFGLEGVNNTLSSITETLAAGAQPDAGSGPLGLATREELLGHTLDWLWDEATATITPTITGTAKVSFFDASMMSTRGGPAVSYRWDFGDGSPIVGPVDTNTKTVGHRYWTPGTYTVTVEATNGLGTRAMASVDVTVPQGAPYVENSGAMIFLPALKNGEAAGGLAMSADPRKVPSSTAQRWTAALKEFVLLR